MSKQRFVGRVLSVLILAGLACNTLVPPHPPVSWDTRPEALIVRATFCCGMVPPTVVRNYVPDVQVWGDGRMIWVQPAAPSQRRVLETHLTTDQMTALLQRAVNDGFFGWQDSYSPHYNVYDYPSQCLSIELTSVSKTVCEYYAGAPKALHTLYVYLAEGAGASGSDFTPTKGYLTAYVQNYGSQPPPPANLHWPANSLGFSLKEAVGGKWVEGEALGLAWQVVNQDQWNGVIQDGEDYYQIAVQIPGVSESEPPAE